MSLGWAPARYDWCPNERRKSAHTHTQREDQVETKEKTVIYTSRREASEETNSTNKGTPASGIMRR